MKILIVDDDGDVVDFFSQVAASLEVETVDTADSGEAAMARALNGQYDMITLDIRMPGASGLDILSMIRNLNPHAVIAIISGQFPDRLTDEQRHCADVLIAKPVRVEALTTLIESAREITGILGKVRALDSFDTGDA